MNANNKGKVCYYCNTNLNSTNWSARPNDRVL